MTPHKMMRLVLCALMFRFRRLAFFEPMSRLNSIAPRQHWAIGTWLAVVAIVVALSPATRSTLVAQAVGWTIQTAPHVVPPPGNPYVYVQGFGIDSFNRPVIGWKGDSGSGGTTGNAWSRLENGAWVTHQMYNPSSSRGRSDLALRSDGNPFYAYADTTDAYIYGLSGWYYARIADLGANPEGPGAATQLINHTQSCYSFNPAFALAFKPGTSSPSYIMSTQCDYSGWLSLDGVTLHGQQMFEPSIVGTGGGFRSIDYATGPAGQPHIAYYVDRGSSYGVFYSNGTPAHELFLAKPGNRGAEVNIAADAANRIHVAIGGIPTCSNTFEGGLLYTTSSDGVTWNRTFVDPTSGRNPSIVLDSTGAPSIAYYSFNTQVRYAYLRNGQWTTVPVHDAPAGVFATSTKVAFNPSGQTNIAYFDPATNDLQIARGGPADQPPYLTTPGNQLSAPGAAVSLQIAASDVEGSPLAYDATCLPPGLAINMSGKIDGTIASNADTTQPYSVTIWVTDQSGGRTASTFLWTVRSNHAPLASNASATIAENTTLTNFALSATDSDGDVLTYSIVAGPAHGTVSLSGNLATYTPAINYVGADSFTFQASDGTAGSTGIVSIDVTPGTHINRPPTVTNPGDKTLAEGTSPSLQISASDPDGDTLTYSASGLPATLAIDTTTGLISGSLSFTSAGTYSATVTVSDGKGGSASASFAWIVTDVNRPPVLAAVGDKTIAAGALLSFVLTASDADGDVLTFNATDLPSGSTLDPSSGTFSWTPTSAQAGTHTVTFRATDTRGASSSQRNTITVTPVITQNRPPICTAAQPSVAEIWPPNHKVVVPISILRVTDPDGDPVTIAVTRILQDEPTDTLGDGSTVIDGFGVGTSQAAVRAERSGTPKVPGNGRVYEIQFASTDGKGGNCNGSVLVGVPHDQGKGPAIDDGIRYDSTVPGGPRVR